MFSRIVLIVLTLIAVALYIRVILPPDESTSVAETQSAPVTAPTDKSDQAAGPAVAPASGTSAAAGTPASGESNPALEPLPAEQMRLVLETLAPELMHKKP